MRVKLEMKKQRDTGSHDHCFCSDANHPTVHATIVTNSKDDQSLDTLLEFINGPDEENLKKCPPELLRDKEEHNANK